MNYATEIANVKTEIAALELKLAHLQKMQEIGNKLEAERMTKKEKLLRFTLKAAAKLTGKKATFKKESKGTVRFTLTNKHGQALQGLYRVRKSQDRKLELQTGDTFTQLHYGKITVGLESAKVRQLWNFAICAE